LYTSNKYQLTSCLSEGVSENILQRKLFIIIESSEMIAQLRLCSIFFLTIIVPMCWLASNTFKLAHCNWGEKSMGIFAELQKEMPEFNTYMTWFFKEKECNTIGSSSKSQRVLSVDKGAEMLFYPTDSKGR